MGFKGIDVFEMGGEVDGECTGVGTNVEKHFVFGRKFLGNPGHETAFVYAVEGMMAHIFPGDYHDFGLVDIHDLVALHV